MGSSGGMGQCQVSGSAGGSLSSSTRFLWDRIAFYMSHNPCHSHETWDEFPVVNTISFSTTVCPLSKLKEVIVSIEKWGTGMSTCFRPRFTWLVGKVWQESGDFALMNDKKDRNRNTRWTPSFVKQSCKTAKNFMIIILQGSCYFFCLKGLTKNNAKISSSGFVACASGWNGHKRVCKE